MADLIERLEADKQRLFGLGLKRMADDIAEAQAEIERLKNAMVETGSIHCPCSPDCGDDCEKCVDSAIEETLKAERRWIPVSERIPEDGSDILVYCDDGEETRIVACNYDNGVWFDCVFNTVMVFKNITHWMPLPKPPMMD